MTGIVRDWWGGLSASERTLTMAAGGLAAILVFTLFVFAPLRAERAAAEARYQRAVELSSEVRAAASASFARPDAPRAADGNVRAVITTSASARGLTISRANPIGENGLAVRFEAADADDLYRWLAVLESEHGVVVRRATVRRGGEGRVQADVVLMGGRTG